MKVLHGTRIGTTSLLCVASASARGSSTLPNAYKVIAVLDTDADGKMEVVVASRYYEGGATTIYRCDPKKIEKLLFVSCGV